MLNRDASSPPPVPCAPTFFKFAVGTSQSKPQSQSTGLCVSSSTTDVRTEGLGGSFGLSVQLTSSPPATTLGVRSSIGVGLGPQATGFGLGLGTANPFRSSVMTPGPVATLPPLPEPSETNVKGKGKQVTLAQEELVQNQSKVQIEAEINELGELKQNLALKVRSSPAPPSVIHVIAC